MIEGIEVLPGTELLQENLMQVNGSALGWVVLIVIFITWILRTERSFDRRVDECVQKKMEIHSLEKKPLYNRVDHLEEQHREILDRLLVLAESMNANIKELSTKQSETDEKVSFILGKMEKS